MNGSPAELLIGVPLTTTDRANKLHVRLKPARRRLDEGHLRDARDGPIGIEGQSASQARPALPSF